MNYKFYYVLLFCKLTHHKIPQHIFVKQSGVFFASTTMLHFCPYQYNHDAILFCWLQTSEVGIIFFILQNSNFPYWINSILSYIKLNDENVDHLCLIYKIKTNILSKQSPVFDGQGKWNTKRLLLNGYDINIYIINDNVV